MRICVSCGVFLGRDRKNAASDSGFPGMAVTVLSGLRESDAAGTAVQKCPEPECFDRQHGSPAAGLKETSRHGWGRNAISITVTVLVQ